MVKMPKVKMPKDIFDLSKHKKTILPVLIVVVVIILAFFVGPSISGFSVYSNELSDCKTEVESCQGKVDEVKAMNKETEEEVSALKNSVAEKQQEMEKIKKEHEEELNTASQRYSVLSSKFNEIVDNCGHNICCKLKYDYPEIDSFNIEDGKVVCSTNGTFRISC